MSLQKRRWFVVLAALGVAGVLLVLSLLRHPREVESKGASSKDQTFIDDSLGVAIRVPASSQWSLHREPGAANGRVVNITHANGRGTVALYLLPAKPEESVEAVLRRRQERVVALFGAHTLSEIIARVVSDTLSEVNGKSFRHWQALTQAAEVPGEKPSRAMFMWLVTKDSRRSVEAIGTVRIPVQQTPEEEAETTTLLEEVGYILQSLVVH